MRVGSLFAGIGGFDLAAERAGMTVEWQSELDPHASNVLAHHWPEVPNHGDIHDIRFEVAERRDARATVQVGAGVRGGSDWKGRGSNSAEIITSGVAAVDVLCGGFPCQDYSVAGKRGGLAGDRGALWWQFYRLIAESNPTWVVGENVPGLLSSNGGRDFATIIDSLVELGYGVAWRVLDAQFFGVAQRRRRVFIVGHSGGEPRPEVLAFGQSVSGDSPPRRETGENTAPTLAARTRGGGWPGSGEAIDGAVVAQCITSRTGGRYDAETETLLPVAFNWQASGADWMNPDRDGTDALHAGQTPAVAFAQNTRDLGNLAGALAAQPGMKQTTYVASALTASYANGIGGQGGQDDLELAVASATNGVSVRRLTPLECERLQGFPDGWTDIPGNSDTQRYRQLGNAVAVPVAEWIMRRLASL